MRREIETQTKTETSGPGINLNVSLNLNNEACVFYRNTLMAKGTRIGSGCLRSYSVVEYLQHETVRGLMEHIDGIGEELNRLVKTSRVRDSQRPDSRSKPESESQSESER